MSRRQAMQAPPSARKLAERRANSGSAALRMTASPMIAGATRRRALPASHARTISITPARTADFQALPSSRRALGAGLPDAQTLCKAPDR